MIVCFNNNLNTYSIYINNTYHRVTKELNYQCSLIVLNYNKIMFFIFMLKHV